MSSITVQLAIYLFFLALLPAVVIVEGSSGKGDADDRSSSFQGSPYLKKVWSVTDVEFPPGNPRMKVSQTHVIISDEDEVIRAFPLGLTENNSTSGNRRNAPENWNAEAESQQHGQSWSFKPLFNPLCQDLCLQEFQVDPYSGDVIAHYAFRMVRLDGNTGQKLWETPHDTPHSYAFFLWNFLPPQKSGVESSSSSSSLLSSYSSSCLVGNGYTGALVKYNLSTGRSIWNVSLQQYGYDHHPLLEGSIGGVFSSSSSPSSSGQPSGQQQQQHQVAALVLSQVNISMNGTTQKMVTVDMETGLPLCQVHQTSLYPNGFDSIQESSRIAGRMLFAEHGSCPPSGVGHCEWQSKIYDAWTSVTEEERSSSRNLPDCKVLVEFQANTTFAEKHHAFTDMQKQMLFTFNETSAELSRWEYGSSDRKTDKQVNSIIRRKRISSPVVVNNNCGGDDEASINRVWRVPITTGPGAYTLDPKSQSLPVLGARSSFEGSWYPFPENQIVVANNGGYITALNTSDGTILWSPDAHHTEDLTSYTTTKSNMSNNNSHSSNTNRLPFTARNNELSQETSNQMSYPLVCNTTGRQAVFIPHTYGYNLILQAREVGSSVFLEKNYHSPVWGSSVNGELGVFASTIDYDKNSGGSGLMRLLVIERGTFNGASTAGGTLHLVEIDLSSI